MADVYISKRSMETVKAIHRALHNITEPNSIAIFERLFWYFEKLNNIWLTGSVNGDPFSAAIPKDRYYTLEAYFYSVTKDQKYLAPVIGCAKNTHHEINFLEPVITKVINITSFMMDIDP